MSRLLVPVRGATRPACRRLLANLLRLIAAALVPVAALTARTAAAARVHFPIAAKSAVLAPGTRLFWAALLLQGRIINLNWLHRALLASALAILAVSVAPNVSLAAPCVMPTSVSLGTSAIGSLDEVDNTVSLDSTKQPLVLIHGINPLSNAPNYTTWDNFICWFTKSTQKLKSFSSSIRFV